MHVLPRQEWRQRREAHRARCDELLAGVEARRRTGERHPVDDFLFDYYNLRPGELRTWHPGLGTALEDPDGEYAGRKFYRHEDGVSSLDAELFWAKRGETAGYVGRLLGAVAARPAHLGCFGMHEWAMVYHLQPEQTRHSYLPLRFEPSEVARIVEQVGLRCSHFDAFRFFTPDAVGLNSTRPTRERQVELDQPGCLHVNMDSYKWAGKLLGAVDSSLLLDCYELTHQIRELDMRASAYDLTAWGYPPVMVETPQGRADYVRRQGEFSERAVGLRSRLLDVVDRLTAVRVATAGGCAAGG